MLALSLYLSPRGHWNHNLSVIHIALVHGFENSIHVFEYLQVQPKRNVKKSDLPRWFVCSVYPLKRVNLGQLCCRFDGGLAMKVLGYSGIAPLKQVLDAFKHH